MPVDRVRRDSVADALASFLRGETGRNTLGTVLQRFFDETREKAKSEKDAYLDSMLADWMRNWRCSAISEETWLTLCRHLAFLKTDLEERPWHYPSNENEETRRQTLMARCHTLGLLVAFGLAYLSSWWIFAAATLVSFLLYSAWMWKHDTLAEEELKRQLQPRLEYFPFADQDEWRAHSHLLDEHRIPAYDAGTFYEPRQVRKWPWFLATPLRWTCYLILAAIFFYMYLFSAVMWPLFLVLMSLPRREASHQQQVTA